MKKILLIASLIACTACSFKSPLSTNGAGFRVKINKKPKRNEMFLQDTLRLSAPIKDIFKNRFNMMVAPAPVSEADFECFAVNVTGPAIPSVNNFDDSCTINDNMNGHGIGFLSEPVAAGEPIDIMVTAGTDRRIDVFGIYPDVAPCSHEDNQMNDAEIPKTSDGGYYLGGTTVDITEPKTVNVTASYDATPASVTCTHNNGNYYMKLTQASGIRTLAPNFVYTYGTSSTLPATPSSSISPFTYLDPAVTNYDGILLGDGGGADTGSGLFVGFDVSYITDLANFTTVTANWSGAAGTDSTCNADTASISAAPTGANLQIWDGSAWANMSGSSLTNTYGPMSMSYTGTVSSFPTSVSGESGTYILVGVSNFVNTNYNPCLKLTDLSLQIQP